MKAERVLRLGKPRGACGLFYACGSFGIIDGAEEYERTCEGDVEAFVLE